MNKNYSGSLALSKLKHVRMKKKGKGGKKVDCLVIPIKANYFVEGKEGAVYMPIRVITKDEEDKYGQHGFVSQSVDTKVWKAADEDQREVFNELPILGNIKDFTGGGDSDAGSGAASDEVLDEDDDLPF